MRTRWSTLVIGIWICLAAACTEGPTVTNTPADSVTVSEPTSSSPLVETTEAALVDDATAVYLAEDTGSDLEQWARLYPVAAEEVEHYATVSDMRDRASAVVVATLGERLEDRVVHGDADDVAVFPHHRLDIHEVLSSRRPVPESLVIEIWLPEAVGQRAIFFLRHMQDGFGGEPEPAFADLPDVWRIVSSQGVLIDRGDGTPINPIVVAFEWTESGRAKSIEEFVATYDPVTGSDPVMSDAGLLTISELLELLRS